MLFNSYEFIFLYLPIVLVIYFFLGSRKKYEFATTWLVLSSIFFMAIGIADMYHYFWPQYVLTI